MVEALPSFPVMTYAPQNTVDVPPFQLQRLIPEVVDQYGVNTGKIRVQCAQALGSEIYVGCSNGELIRFALQADDPTKTESYTVISKHNVPGNKPVDEIVLIPSLSRALVLSDRQIHFYSIPSLDLDPIKPIRNVITFAVDDQHLRRPLPSQTAAGLPIPMEPVEFCVIKRSGISLFNLKDRLIYTREVPLQAVPTLARRCGNTLCIADKTYYSIVDLEAASIFPILPLSQSDEQTSVVQPSITVISQNEFLILSWTGASTLGVFITRDGDPVRGTLEWISRPQAICLDYPYITSLLLNNTIEVHNIETQIIAQVVSAPISSRPQSKQSSPNPSLSRADSKISIAIPDPSRRTDLVSSIGTYLVPSTERSDKMRKVPIKLLRS